MGGEKMFIGRGDDLMDGLMGAKATCPNCNTTITFKEGALLAKEKGYTEQVVMCKKCNKVYGVHLVPGKMTLLPR